MLKKLLSIVLSTVMICSSALMITAGAIEKTQWTENFDSYASLEEILNEEGTQYSLNDGWVMTVSEDALKTHMSLNDGERGKKNGDKSLSVSYDASYNGKTLTLTNSLGGNKVSLGDGSAIGISFDWYDTMMSGTYAYADREIYATVDLKDSEENSIENERIFLGTIRNNRFFTPIEKATLTAKNAAFSSYYPMYSGNNSNDGALESWNDFIMYVSDSSVIAHSASVGGDITFDVKNFDPNTDKWASANNSAYEIISVSKIEVVLTKNRKQNATASDIIGIDNLNVWFEADGAPASLTKKEMIDFIDFTSIQKLPSARTNAYGGYNYYNFSSSAVTNRRFISGADAFTSVSEGRIALSLVTDENDTAKTANSIEDAQLKISSNPVAKSSSSTYYVIGYKTGNNPVAGDKVQASFDMKFKPATNAIASDTIFSVKGILPTGSFSNSPVANVTADGTVMCGDTVVTKLEANKFYSFNVVYSLTEEGTVAELYINGVPVDTRTSSVNGANDNALVSLQYNPSTTEVEGVETYIANAVYLDNICCQVVKGGVGAYNFNKSLKASSNKVLAAAGYDLINNVISPVSSDFTVGEFISKINMPNVSVVKIEDGVETVADNNTLLSDSGIKIKITGEYGEAMYYTASENGGTRVGKDSLVVIKQGDNVLPVGSNVNTTSPIVAQAYAETAQAVVITAEYNSAKELVDVRIGQGYTPTEAGNTIKVFALNNLSSIVPISPETVFVVE